MNKFTFETGIDLPSTETHFRKMKPGDSVFLPRPFSQILYREFMAECGRNKWQSVDEARTENGIAGIRVWLLKKPRTAAETDNFAVMQRVLGVLSKARAALTPLEIAKNCLAFGRLGTEEREKLMTTLVYYGCCIPQKSEKTTRYRYAALPTGRGTKP